MAKLEGLVAFRAALELFKERNLYHIVDEVYAKCKSQENFKDSEVELRNGYLRTFEPQEVSDKIAEMLSSPEIKAEVKIIFQTVEDLHIACPKHLGLVSPEIIPHQENRVVNRAFMNFTSKDARAY
jgi:amidophosphoribosyltransferase